MLSLTLLLSIMTTAPADLRPDRPWPSELQKRYDSTAKIGSSYTRLVFNAQLTPHWLESGDGFWYRSLVRGKKAFLLIDPATAGSKPAFDHEKLAASLSEATSKSVKADKLPFDVFRFVEHDKSIQFDYQGKTWTCHLADYSLTSKPVEAQTRPVEEPWAQNLWPPETDERPSPDAKQAARIKDLNVTLRNADKSESALTKDGRADSYYAHLEWTPDGKRIIATKVNPGDRNKVYLIQNTPPKWGPAVLKERVYDRPGDKIDTFEQVLLDPATGSSTKVKAGIIDYGDMPELHWRKDGVHYLYERVDRGYGRYRVIEVNSITGESRDFIDEHPKTFVDTTSQYIHFCKETEEIVYRSERDGYGHLYLVDPSGAMKQLTSGPWVVREVVRVDEMARKIWFTASGVHAGEDPYFIHYFSVGFDGGPITELTPATGDHHAELAPDGKYLVDTYSQVDVAPVHELRDAQGKLVMDLGKADIKDLLASGFQLPEQFSAKGRDGKTDIYGVVYRPSYYDPKVSYPILEDIYAGPQDSFVPKSFGSMGWDSAMAELGFIVVKIDGMGTRNRGKAFQDVCYKNLADAGFEDRILWMKALHAKMPSADIGRVGVFGTSAGGQSSAGAVLFHPEFYKVAVSSCGCHDNRLDKIWWNEQWMGLVGPHYAKQSNITNASRLQGNLMLIVGELDTNVPPESTYRFGEALIRANKDYELVVIPNSDHTSGGVYGEHKRRDFFVKHLIGVDPPAWNVKG